MKFKSVFWSNHLIFFIIILIGIFAGCNSNEYGAVNLFLCWSGFYAICVFIPDLRMIELTKEGCTVHLFRLKKQHKWKDILYIHRDIVSSRNAAFEGIFFSTKATRKHGKELTARRIHSSLDLFNSFCIFWKDEKEKEKVLNQLKEWGVEVITSPKLAEKEAYEQKLAEKINLREQRKKLYKKRNK